MTSLFLQTISLPSIRARFHGDSAISLHLTSRLCCAPRLCRPMTQLSHSLYCLTISDPPHFPLLKTPSRSRARLPPGLSLRAPRPRIFLRIQMHQLASCRHRHNGSKWTRCQATWCDLLNHGHNYFSQWAQWPHQTSNVAAWSGILDSQAPHRIWLCKYHGSSEHASILWV